jgi:hypothetical protein
MRIIQIIIYILIHKFKFFLKFWYFRNLKNEEVGKALKLFLLFMHMKKVYTLNEVCTHLHLFAKQTKGKADGFGGSLRRCRLEGSPVESAPVVTHETYRRAGGT